MASTVLSALRVNLNLKCLLSHLSGKETEAPRNQTMCPSAKAKFNPNSLIASPGSLADGGCLQEVSNFE